MRIRSLVLLMLLPIGLLGCGGSDTSSTDAYADLAYTHNTPLNPTQAALAQQLVLYFTVGNKGPDPMLESTVTIQVGQGLRLNSVGCIPDPISRAACPPAIATTESSATFSLPPQQAGGFVTIVPIATPTVTVPSQVNASASVSSPSDRTAANNSAALTIALQ